MATAINKAQEKIAVIGLGYVGLPLALAFARKHRDTIGFDVDQKKVAMISRGEDPNREGFEAQLKDTVLKATAKLEDLQGCTFFVVSVPTPIDEHHRPDMTLLKKACVTVGKVLSKGAVVVFESTVYPGVTEEICGPILAEASGLKQGVDFKLGYSPERINPGDEEHGLEGIVKVVSGEDQPTLERVAAVYESVVTAGVHRTSSIKVAEAAKVIENTQRDLNIALMNELSIIFDRLDISTREVLEAAATKWNFVRFTPGLVGGHCIGVDPYYLTTKAEQVGYIPEVILAGRRINDGMGRFVARRLVKLMINEGIGVRDARVAILGLTFKENVSDIRNSRIPDIAAELSEFGIKALIHDPLANPSETEHEYGIKLAKLEELQDLDALVVAVAHQVFTKDFITQLIKRIRKPGVVVDVKSMIDRTAIPAGVMYWSL